jgi:hypothetical protein
MASWMNWLNSRPLERQFDIRPTPAGVEAVRRALLSALDDCEGFECDRLRWRLHTAECAQDLWLLRDALFQVVASQHCQDQAAQRIDQLAPAFRQVLPGRFLGPV